MSVGQVAPGLKLQILCIHVFFFIGLQLADGCFMQALHKSFLTIKLEIEYGVNTQVIKISCNTPTLSRN